MTKIGDTLWRFDPNHRTRDSDNWRSATIIGETSRRFSDSNCHWALLQTNFDGIISASEWNRAVNKENAARERLTRLSQEWQE